MIIGPTKTPLELFGTVVYTDHSVFEVLGLSVEGVLEFESGYLIPPISHHTPLPLNMDQIPLGVSELGNLLCSFSRVLQR